MSYLKLILIFLLGVVMISCSTSPGIDNELNLSGEFSYQALEGYMIFELQSHESELFAGTSNGLVQFERSFPLQVSDTYLNSGEVRTFLILEYNYWLASTGFENSDSTNLYRSIDQGETWHIYNNGFGGEEKWVPNTMELAKNTSTVYARATPFLNVAKSTDMGTSWESVLYTWDNSYFGTSMFVKIDQNNQNIVWAGGATALFYPQLIRSKDAGKNWEYITLFEDVIETTANDIFINHRASSQVMVGLEIGVLSSTDDGETWNSAFNEAAIYTFTHSAANSEIVYASGVNAQGQLFFIASNDFGDTWQTIEYPESPAGIRVNDMVSVMEGGQEVIYLGTNKGLYSFTIE